MVKDTRQDTEEPRVEERPPFGSGIGTVHDALDRLVTERDLDDAALVIDSPVLGRQVLRAGRRPLRDDEQGLLTMPPGLYVEPSDTDRVDALVTELLVALADLGLRHDTARAAALDTPPDTADPALNLDALEAAP
jgi:hypothetical protein